MEPLVDDVELLEELEELLKELELDELKLEELELDELAVSGLPGICDEPQAANTLALKSVSDALYLWKNVILIILFCRQSSG